MVLKNRAWSPSEHASELVGLPVSFCRCSEGLSDVPSRSVAGSRPASLS
ncbi:hypothetical protein A2U01_0106992 [Trifolium medium]|uniref:Uncharacterized protein n=1 Tax=Trifolium medium TaxID=97028 RepID=A0A392VE48_9FABA|nr:hypothetical protein [Trifolium medium]